MDGPETGATFVDDDGPVTLKLPNVPLPNVPLVTELVPARKVSTWISPAWRSSAWTLGEHITLEDIYELDDNTCASIEGNTSKL